MTAPKKINSVLISVFHKEGLDTIIPTLTKLGVTIYSTGGTSKYIKSLGGTVVEVADMTEYPSILGGRVKTLHPKVFGGILARRNQESDAQDSDTYNIPMIDAVIVDLYPFEETVASGAEEAQIIEKIDIGGISLIRAAAKNYKDVLIIPSFHQFEWFSEQLVSQNGEFTLAQRKKMAAEAFNISSHYDTQIYSWMNPEPDNFKVSITNTTPLRYGENPHQKAWYFGDLSKQFEQLSGKALSYNNLVDIEGAVGVVDEFEEPCFAIIKHTNPCGLAIGKDIEEAWTKALECDPVSAFGGILACNGEINEKVASEINNIFYEVLIADSFTEGAKKILTSKKKRIVLRRVAKIKDEIRYKSLLGGVIMQEEDSKNALREELVLKTSHTPKPEDYTDILFAEKAVKHLKSNAICIVKNQQLIGSGIGQTSRVDAMNHAVQKAKEKGFDLKGSVLGSDAFFPFDDCARIAFEHDIHIILEPGGSIKDEDTIKFCESHGMCLLFNQIRHFRH